MVDLAFLAHHIFYVDHKRWQKPTIMPVVMPEKDVDKRRFAGKLKNLRYLTLILGADDKNLFL